ncbi:MAG: O-antigen ligase family protein [Bacteroidales bacterium]|jgi:O-antigen ligase|nr:O-antigen ligase family protein [Bacteroidales bacterium]
MKNTIEKADIIQYLLSTIFILNLFVSEISNYKPYSFYIKGISSATLLFLTWIDYKLNIRKFIQPNQINFRIFYIILLLFILIPTLSLFYSHNVEFGIMKIGYILISVFPSIFVFIYFLQTASRDRTKIFLNTVLFVGLIFGIVSIIFSPYNPTTGYSFELSRWSHVIAGRFLSATVVIVLLMHFFSLVKSKYFLVVVTTILFVSVYFVGLRASFLGIIILISSLIFYALIAKKKKALISISLALFFTVMSILLIGQLNNSATDRYNKLITNDVGEFEDGAINARLIAYNVSWENMLKHPFGGIGFGGFYNHSISGDIAEIKYPHNLLIEIQLELGIIGSIFFLALLALIFWRAYKFSIPLFVFLLFSFWLAMFSKDIPTQTQLWIGMAVLGIKKRKGNDGKNGMME